MKEVKMYAVDVFYDPGLSLGELKKHVENISEIVKKAGAAPDGVNPDMEYPVNHFLYFSKEQMVKGYKALTKNGIPCAIRLEQAYADERYFRGFGS